MRDRDHRYEHEHGDGKVDECGSYGIEHVKTSSGYRLRTGGVSLGMKAPLVPGCIERNGKCCTFMLSSPARPIQYDLHLEESLAARTLDYPHFTCEDSMNVMLSKISFSSLDFEVLTTLCRNRLEGLSDGG